MIATMGASTSTDTLDGDGRAKPSTAPLIHHQSIPFRASATSIFLVLTAG
jgi:hypothetical protein